MLISKWDSFPLYNAYIKKVMNKKQFSKNLQLPQKQVFLKKTFNMRIYHT
jgi:hypothetical protein